MQDKGGGGRRGKGEVMVNTRREWEKDEGDTLEGTQNDHGPARGAVAYLNI